MSEKDKKAKKRVEDEIILKDKISKLLKEFSKKYDVIAYGIDINKNPYYPCNGDYAEHQMTQDFPMPFDSDMTCAIVVFQIRVDSFNHGTFPITNLSCRRKFKRASASRIGINDRNMSHLFRNGLDFFRVIGAIR